METNLLGAVLQILVSCFIGILMGRGVLWGFPYLIEKNEMKVVKKGYKRLLSWYWYLSGTRLSDAAQVELVKLAGTSKVHKDILLKYNDSLCYDASILLVENDDLSEILEEFLSYREGDIQSALIKKSETSERCKKLLLNYIRKGCLLEKNVLSLDDDMFAEYCKNDSFLDSKVESCLIKKAGVDQKFKTILVGYIRRKNNCSRKSIHVEPECQLIQEKLFDVIEEYRNVVKNFGESAQAKLVESFKSDNRFRKAMIKEIPVLSKKSFDDLVAYTLQNDQLIDILEVCVSIRKFDNDQEVGLVEAYQKNKKYTLVLREYIKKYELCSSAQNLLMVPV